MEVAVDAMGLTKKGALIYNSLKWSLKCNSKGDVTAETLFTHAFVPHGEGGREWWWAGNALRGQGGSSQLNYRGNASRKF